MFNLFINNHLSSLVFIIFQQVIGSARFHCANKNNSAEITIDDEGYLILTSHVDENRIVYLSNIFAAKDISSNLISLRHFGVKGSGIYLNDSIVEIFDRNTKEIYIYH